MNVLLRTGIFFLFATQSAHAQWQAVQALPDQHFLALCEADDQLFAATFNRIFRSADAGQTWIESGTVPIMFDDEITDLVVRNNIYYVSSLLNGCFLSVDEGQTWAEINNGLAGLGSKNISTLVIRDDTLYAATLGAGVFRRPLSNPSAMWTSFNMNLGWGNVQSLFTDGQLLLAGAGASATVSRVEQGSTFWFEHNFDAFNGEINLFLGCIRAGNRLVGAGTQGLYRSENNGLTWAHFNPGLGLIERASFAQFEGKIYALLGKPGSHFLRTSSDQGETWTVPQHNLSVGGQGFELLSHKGRLFCARQNGLWVLSPTVSNEEPAAVIEITNLFPNPAQQFTTLTFTTHAVSSVRIVLLNMLGQTIEVRNLDHLPVGAHRQDLQIGNLPAGAYWVRIEAGSAWKNMLLRVAP